MSPPPVSRGRSRRPTPFLVAHRAGNDLGLLRRAEDLHVPLIEADVRLHSGRLEVRHLKTLGPVPILWDRWRIAPPWTPRVTLPELLGAARPTTELMLDLKGGDLRLAALVRAALAESGRRSVTVCSQNWALLDALHGIDGLRTVYSVGGRRALRALRRRFAGSMTDGVSIHRKLLDPATVRDLRAITAMLLSWPVETPEEARELTRWGVDGLITEKFEALGPMLGAHG